MLSQPYLCLLYTSTIIVIVVIVLIAIWGITSYNGMVQMDESVSTAWSNVENPVAYTHLFSSAPALYAIRITPWKGWYVLPKTCG